MSFTLRKNESKKLWSKFWSSSTRCSNARVARKCYSKITKALIIILNILLELSHWWVKTHIIEANPQNSKHLECMYMYF